MKRLFVLLVLLGFLARRQVCNMVVSFWHHLTRLLNYWSEVESYVINIWDGVPNKRLCIGAVILLLITIGTWCLIRCLVDKYAKKSVQHIVSDEPERELGSDRLGRAGYVSSLVYLLHNADPSKAQIVGIYGKWGDGKTSAIKMLENYCRTKNKSLKFVWYMPWAAVSKRDLHAELFKAIGSRVMIINPIMSLLFLQYACQKTVKLYPDTNGIFQFFAVVFAELLNFLSSLDSVKQDLIKVLRKSRRRVVVVVDDVDRLSMYEARDLVRCLKTNGDLPNVTYLLLTDDAILAKMIAGDYAQPGNSAEDLNIGCKFLEKIVTYPMPLWPVTPECLLFELKQNVEAVLNRNKISGYEISENDYDFAIRICDNLRHIKRLVSMYDVSLAYYSANRDYITKLNARDVGLNIHFGDALRLSVLRILSSPVVSVIYKYYDAWCRWYRLSYMTVFELPEKKYEEFFSQIPEEYQEIVQKFMREVLSISSSDVAGGKSKKYIMEGAVDPQRNFLKSFRMASPGHFRRYFNASELPNMIIPQTDLLDFYKKAADIEGFKIWANEVFKRHNGIYYFETLRLNSMSAVHCSPIDVVNAVDWLVSRVDSFVTGGISSNCEMMDAAIIALLEYLDRCRESGSLSEGDEREISHFLMQQNSYSIIVHWLGYAVGRLDPELETNSKKINGSVASEVWTWVKDRLFCKMYDHDIANRKDAEAIQRHFNWLVMYKSAVDGEMYRCHLEYLIQSMDDKFCMRRLRTLGRYERDIASGETCLAFDFYTMDYQHLFCDVVNAACDALIKYQPSMTADDARVFVAAAEAVSLKLPPKVKEIIGQLIGNEGEQGVPK